MMSSHEFGGGCLCGGVKLKVKGNPSTAGIYHCESCRKWHAAPFNSWALWRNESVEITQGEDLLQGYDSGSSHRFWCGNCGSGLLNRKPHGGTVVYAMALAESGYKHDPSCHIHCDESVYEVKDGLPHYVDLPEKWGGFGETVLA